MTASSLLCRSTGSSLLLFAQLDELEGGADEEYDAARGDELEFEATDDCQDGANEFCEDGGTDEF